MHLGKKQKTKESDEKKSKDQALGNCQEKREKKDDAGVAKAGREARGLDAEKPRQVGSSCQLDTTWNRLEMLSEGQSR